MSVGHLQRVHEVDPSGARRMVADDDSILRAADRLREGGLVAFPTETVYGLGADGLNPQAVRRIFEVKGRPADHPVILHVADIQAARQLARHWPQAADVLARTFWPGPLTLILPRADGIPDQVTGGQDTVGVRVPDHPVAMALLRAFSRVGSGVIAAPSANIFGSVSPTTADHVLRGIGPRMDGCDVILDGGACQVGVESTIVDLSRSGPRILRPGGVPRAAILACLQDTGPAIDTSGEGTPSPRVSGSLEAHYAPRARIQLLSRAQMLLAVAGCRRPGCLCIGSPLQIADMRIEGGLWQRIMPDDPQDYARKMYAALHDADHAAVSDLLIEDPPHAPAWEAVRDRLTRARTGSQ